ncbi:receptor-like protein EIX1 [Cornus florida]|uniref:receptor-like protein EIX1 n=1 Tax=Cornus florida TaxID=4283 RepID=UPI00289AD16E|nr:receptor-like protein EIX1 [Cornus florida]
MTTFTNCLLAFVIIATTISIKGLCDPNSDVVCIESERQALLRFKQHLKDPSNRLLSWTIQDDCCKWAGVVCNNLTGHVHELHLCAPPPPPLRPPLYDEEDLKLGGNIDASLINLKHLRYLDLSNNEFGGIRIPGFIGSLKSLRYLNLSLAGFDGVIPHQLGNLSSLRYLILGDSDYYFNHNSLRSGENLKWLSGLALLQHLDMSGVNLSRTYDWPQVMNSLPCLVELHVSLSSLTHFVPLSPVNFTSLRVLDISDNSLSSLSPIDWLFSIKGLISLNLGYNNFQGPIPSGLLNMSSTLIHLDLSSNDLNSTIPTWLYSFKRLESLHLGFNSLQGVISSDIGNMTSLIDIDLTNNQLEGNLPSELQNLCNLKAIGLGDNRFRGDVSQVFKSLSVCAIDVLESLELHLNQLSGHLTDHLGYFKSLRSLVLSGNLISGAIPENLGRLSKLEFLWIGDNLLEGVVSEVHFAGLANLILLYASQNSLTLQLSPNWIPPFQLQVIHLRSLRVGPEFPMWIGSQKEISNLDLSSACISDEIPSWFWNLSSSAHYVDLSHNQIHGHIPYIPNFYLNLNSNKFSGPLPIVSPNVYALDLSNNSFSGDISDFLCHSGPHQLEFLQLDENLLSGNIPECWMNWPSLEFINLQNNNFTGTISSSMGFLSSLKSLHLRNNSLSGELPLSLQNCTNLLAIDLGKNKFAGSIPSWIGKRLSKLMVLGLRSNKFYGKIPHEICYLTSLQILDLAYNNLSGAIPRCINKFTTLALKGNFTDDDGRLNIYSNFSGQVTENAFVVTKGREIQYDIILRFATSMDFSSNNLSGEIPEELTSLLVLQSLNLSGNHLTGLIPRKIGNMVQLESLDLSRNQLSGEIPSSMSDMTFLSYLNLSYNYLSGKIPSSTQLQSFDVSSFIGNDLCGPPVPKNCSVNEVIPKIQNGRGKGNDAEVNWFYLSLALGFVVGFWGVCGPLLYSKSWRFSYFHSLDCMWYKITGCISNKM